MSGVATWPMMTILGLGLWHGLNPGMGWLFAVALGLQERERRAVWRALLPLAAGHALAIATALAVAYALGLVLPAVVLRRGIALALVVFGIDRLRRNRHPRYGGMRMTMRRLVVWSFLMATAHGAGLMILPFAVRGHESVAGPPHAHGLSVPAEEQRGGRAIAGPVMRVHGQSADDTGVRNHAGDRGNRSVAWLVLTTHTLGFLFATGLIAVIVYEKLGLQLLSRVWVNLDLVWGIALIATGLLVPVIS